MTAGRETTAALVLAGRRGGNDPLLSGYPDLPSKALLPVAGEAMVRRVLRALGERPVWISGLSAQEAGADVRSAPPAPGPAAAVLEAVAAGAPLPLLVTTADHVLLDADMVAEFEKKARESGGDLCVGLAERSVIEGRFPSVQRTYLRFADASVSGCNLFYIASGEGLAGVRFWRQAEQDRKKPWRLARRIGPMVLLRYVTGRLTLEGLFAHASKRLGAKIRPVLLSRAEAAVDVDKPSDLELVEAVLGGRA